MSIQELKQWADALNEIAYQRGAEIMRIRALLKEFSDLYMAAEFDEIEKAVKFDGVFSDLHDRVIAYLDEIGE